MENEKRLLLAITLSMAVLLLTPYLFQLFFPPPPDPELVEEVVVEPAPEPPVPEEPQLDLPALVEPVEVPEEEVPPVQAEPRSVWIENEDMVLRVNNVGGVLESVQLKGYDRLTDDPLEILPQDLPSEFPRPLTLKADDERLDEILVGAVYEVRSVEGDRVRAPARVEFHFRRGPLEVSRTVDVAESGYAVAVETDVRAGGVSLPYRVVVGSGIGIYDPGWVGDFSNPRIAYFHNDKLQRYRPKDLEEGAQIFEVGPRWLGIDSKYFTYLLLGPGQFRGMRLSKSEWVKEIEETREVVPVLLAEASVQRGSRLLFVAAPKDFEILGGIDRSLNQLVDFGWFGIIVTPLLFALKFIYNYVGNFGWSIIILTFVINLALFPVRYKQMVSMKKMAELQPKMKSIQDKYKRMKRDDPRKQQMNQEVMALYQQHGVNPLGGCLPLVIQMPFLFAFYRMLDTAIELRGAPFILWIQDLSLHDPYYVTPVVMGATMLAQQAIMPGLTDPMQRRMMMLLPVVFTFFFLGLSSGLVIYFLFSNVFGMLFQLAMQKVNPELAPTPAGAKPAARSAKKKKKG